MLVLALLLVQELEVRHADPPFTARVPPGFVAFGEGEGYRWKNADGSIRLRLQILPGRVGRATVKDVQAAGLRNQKPGTSFRTHEVPWKTFRLPVLETDQAVDDFPVSVFIVQIPLKPRAVQVWAMGRADRREQVERVFRALVAGLDGETNWLSPGERARVLAKIAPALFGWSAWLVYGLVWLVAFRGRPDRALGLRMTWMGATALLLLAAAGIRLFVVEKAGEPPSKGSIAALGAGLACAQRAVQHWKRRAALRASA